MTRWEALAIACWLAPAPADVKARYEAAAADLGCIARTTAIDLAAAFALAAIANDNASRAACVLDDHVRLLAATPATWVWRDHRGAILSVLESIAETAPAWSDAGVVVAALGRLLDDDGRRAIADRGGVSFRRSEQLCACIAADLVAAAPDRRADAARAALQRVTGALGTDPPAPVARPPVESARDPWDAVPFASLCTARGTPIIDDVARRFARLAHTDVRSYDRVPLHVAAASALLPLLHRRDAACAAIDGADFDDIPQTLAALGG